MIVNFIINSLKMCRYLIYMLVRENFKNYIARKGSVSDRKNDSVAILANGPSLNNILKNWKSNKDITEGNVVVVNYFCTSSYFQEIKPSYYVLSDPQFYDPQCPIFEKGKEVFDVLNEKVSWEMNLYVQFDSLKLIDYKKYIKNSNISVIPFHTKLYSGYEKLRFFFYKRGLGSANYGTVALNAIYIMLNLGYKNLYLYGIDHTFFDGLTVDDENTLCAKITHFYSNETELKPLVNFYYHKKTNETMITYLTEKLYVFKGHKDFYNYAKFLKAEIYNCTEGSLVDVYPRRKPNLDI